MKKFKPLGYLLVFTMPALLPLGAWLGRHGLGADLAAWFPIFFIFAVVPVADYLVGTDRSNPADDEQVARLQGSWYYRALTFACVPVQLALLAWSAAAFSAQSLSWHGMLGWLVSHGVIGAVVSMNVAHELIHQRARIERMAGGLLLATVCYAGFKVQHLRGHHVHVSTPNDPSSARLGESLYRFLGRALAIYPHEAWRLEAERLRSIGASPLHWRNELIWWTALSLAFLVAATFAFGAAGALFFLGQSFFAAATLEVTNYIEHYGLERRQADDGRYERTTHRHSWNSNYLVTNLLLFQLQRHSDHHFDARRRYQALRHHDDSPQLPGGYAAMFLLAFVPPLWRRVIHPRIEAARAADARA